MKIEILGTGCPKCKKLTENVQQAIRDAGLDAEVVKIEDIKKITEYGIMMTPGLVIDGKLKSVGKILTPEEIKRLVT